MLFRSPDSHCHGIPRNEIAIVDEGVGDRVFVAVGVWEGFVGMGVKVAVGGKVISGVRVAAISVGESVAVGGRVFVGVGLFVERRTITTAMRSGKVAEFEL